MRWPRESSATPIPVPRYGFLLDKALILCKRRGDSYETKDIVDLHSHQLRDGGLSPHDSKKVPWEPNIQFSTNLGVQVPGGPKHPGLVGPSVQVLGGLKCPGLWWTY